MSLWWASKDQLDAEQIALIEQVSLRQSSLILGPPGCGKTNVLLRRAQFVRGQNMPNVLVLTFTRPLTEFVRTGCVDAQGREIFPRNCITTIESWVRSLYRRHRTDLPDAIGGLIEWKRRLAGGAIHFANANRMPQYDALFVDEAQDLLQEEVDLIAAWSPVRFFVGDDRQKIYPEAEGLPSVRQTLLPAHERVLRYHYRLARPICRAADRVLLPPGGATLESTCHYNGPVPATVTIQPNPQPREEQLTAATARLRQQIRVYADFIEQGDRIAVVVARKADREVVFDHLSEDPLLRNMVQIIRAREADEADYDPTLDPTRPICILTAKGCKGLEFRTVHWLFAEELSHHHGPEDYYTVITRAKTSLDVYYTDSLPDILARAHSEDGVVPW